MIPKAFLRDGESFPKIRQRTNSTLAFLPGIDCGHQILIEKENVVTLRVQVSMGEGRGCRYT